MFQPDGKAGSEDDSVAFYFCKPAARVKNLRPNCHKRQLLSGVCH